MIKIMKHVTVVDNNYYCRMKVEYGMACPLEGTTANAITRPIH